MFCLYPRQFVFIMLVLMSVKERVYIGLVDIEYHYLSFAWWSQLQAAHIQ